MTATTSGPTEPLESEEPGSEEPVTLLSAVVDLSSNVVLLTSRLSISDKIAQRSRRLSLAVTVLVVIVLVGGSLNQFRIQHAVSGNTANSIQSCQNANETRAANLALWTTVLDYVQGAGKDPSLIKLQAWITLLYAPHDCSDLGRVYKIPSPPVLGAS